MQLDYYRSPSQVYAPQPNIAAAAAPPKQPRRRNRGRLVLILFAILIALSAAGLVVMHILNPDSWDFSWSDFASQFEDPDFFFGLPDDFYEDSDYWGSGDAVTTIPRADPDPTVTLTLTDAPEQSLRYQDIYSKVIPSIVSIQSYDAYSAYEGTGVIMTQDGYIITNHHVIAGCSSVDVVLSDGTRYEAKLTGSDVESDLAVLKIEATGLTPAEFGNSDQLQVGDEVLALGNPLGSELFGTLTEGIVSAINRNVNVEGYNMSLLQTTAALNPGNSGGALLNSSGQVVGITNMKMMSDYETIEGLGFAIPTIWAKEVVDTLLAEGAMTGRPTMGISCWALSPEDAAYYGCSHGVYIDSVTSGGPAAKAGLRSGDIITECNGHAMASLEDLTLVRDEAGVGGTLEMTILRHGETLELSLVLVEQYELN